MSVDLLLQTLGQIPEGRWLRLTAQVRRDGDVIVIDDLQARENEASA
jgi:hypothetical protein